MKKPKTSQLLMLIVLTLVVIVPLTRLYSTEPGVDACMIEYVDTLDGYDPTGFLYNIEGLNHIEPEQSIYNKYIKEYKVGYSKGCIMASGRLFTDFNNSVYCSLTYMTKVGADQYFEGEEITMLERFKTFKANEQKLHGTLRSDLMIMEDMLFEYIMSSKGDVFLSLKFLAHNAVYEVKKIFSVVH